jgi:hypothetical protein
MEMVVSRRRWITEAGEGGFQVVNVDVCGGVSEDGSTGAVGKNNTRLWADF